MSDTNSMVNFNARDIFGVGELAKNGAEAFVTIFPGWKVVNAAKAQVKVEKVLNEGLDDLVEEGGRRGWSEDFLAVRIQGFMESLGRKANLDAIVGYAKAALGGDDPINEDTIRPIDSEWLNYFVDHAERVTDEDVRMVWGAILSGEVNRPGAYSKRTMSTLAAMGRTDVERFRKLCRYLVCTPDNRLLALEMDEGGATYNEGGISYEDLSELSAWGLVNLHGEAKVHLDPEPKIICASYADGAARIYGIGEKGSDSSFSIILTSVGRELASLCDERDMHTIVRYLKRKADRGELGLELLGHMDVDELLGCARDDMPSGREQRATGFVVNDSLRVITKEEIDALF